MFFKIYLKTKNNYLILSSLIIFIYFVPFLPKGSFFTNWNAIIFWTVFAFIYSNYIKLKKIYFHKNTISKTANTIVLTVIVYHLISSTSSDV